MSLSPWELMRLEEITDPYDEVIDLPEPDLDEIKECFPARQKPDELCFKDVAKQFNIKAGFQNFEKNNDDDDEYPGATNFS